MPPIVETETSGHNTATPQELRLSPSVRCSTRARFRYCSSPCLRLMGFLEAHGSFCNRPQRLDRSITDLTAGIAGEALANAILGATACKIKGMTPWMNPNGGRLVNAGGADPCSLRADPCSDCNPPCSRHKIPCYFCAFAAP